MQGVVRPPADVEGPSLIPPQDKNIVLQISDSNTPVASPTAIEETQDPFFCPTPNLGIVEVPPVAIEETASVAATKVPCAERGEPMVSAAGLMVSTVHSIWQSVLPAATGVSKPWAPKTQKPKTHANSKT